MATEAQIRANQENAKKSTGPKTPEGKARSAQNARIHGLCANTMLLTCKEDEDHVMERCREISDQYPFDHALKQSLVTALANAEYQIRFINRMKKGVAIHLTDIAIDQLWGSEPMPKDSVSNWEMLTRLIGIAFLRDASDKNVMFKLNRYEAEQHRIFHRAMIDLEKLYDKWKNQQPQPVEQPAEEPPKEADEPNPNPKPIAENRPVNPDNNGFDPITEPEFASQAQGFNPVLAKTPVLKEDKSVSGQQNCDPLLPKAA